jgi:hypothetical protein
VFGRSGSGAPSALIPCQINIPMTKNAAATRPMRRANFIGMKSYHRHKITAVDQLHFFSGSLHARLPPVADQFTLPGK